jgi:hypothetical protein
MLISMNIMGPPEEAVDEAVEATVTEMREAEVATILEEAEEATMDRTLEEAEDIDRTLEEAVAVRSAEEAAMTTVVAVMEITALILAATDLALTIRVQVKTRVQTFVVAIDRTLGEAEVATIDRTLEEAEVATIDRTLEEAVAVRNVDVATTAVSMLVAVDIRITIVDTPVVVGVEDTVNHSVSMTKKKTSCNVSQRSTISKCKHFKIKCKHCYKVRKLLLFLQTCKLLLRLCNHIRRTCRKHPSFHRRAMRSPPWIPQQPFFHQR